MGEVMDDIFERGEMSRTAALTIYDESSRYFRNVTKQVLSAVVMVLGGYLLVGLAVVLQQLQSGLELGAVQPSLGVAPVAGETIVAGYGLLSGLILTIRFGVGHVVEDGSIVALARERASRQLLHLMARLSVVASILLAAVALGTYVTPVVPHQLDLYRTMAPVFLSLGLAIVAADAAMRSGEERSLQLQWAALKRERQELRRRLALESSAVLSSTQRWVQGGIAFGAVPVGLAIGSSMSWPAWNLRLFCVQTGVVVGVSVLAFFLVRGVQFRLMTGRTLDALGMALLWSMIGLVYWMVGALPGLPESAQTEIPTAPIARGLTVIGLISITGPFFTMLVLSLPTIPGPPGLVRNSTRQLCVRRAAMLKQRMKEIRRSQRRGANTRPENDAATAATVLAFAFPFNILSGMEGLLQARRLDGVGRKRSVLALVVGMVGGLGVVGVLLYLLIANPSIVWCSGSHESVCLSTNG